MPGALAAVCCLVAMPALPGWIRTAAIDGEGRL